jgi:hypothetical protein
MLSMYGAGRVPGGPTGPGYGQGNDAFRGDAIVIDPQVPADDRRLLAGRPASVLIRYSEPTPALTPYQEPAKPDQGSAKGCAFTAVPFFVGAFIAWLAGSSVSEYILLGIGAAVLVLSAFVAWDDHDSATAKQVKAQQAPRQLTAAAQHAVVAYHRRYALPATDFDTEAGQVWARAIAAANRIARSEVVRQQLIDSVQVTAVLPEWLWNVAERLARLSEVRDRQEQIFRNITPDDPDIAAIAARQRRVQELLAKDVEERVRNLEAFADRLDKADNWRRKLAAVEELAGLNSLHIDILALLGRQDWKTGSPDDSPATRKPS